MAEHVNVLSAFWIELHRANFFSGLQYVEVGGSFLSCGVGVRHFGEKIKDLAL
jgi:hypothetical protein